MKNWTYLIAVSIVFVSCNDERKTQVVQTENTPATEVVYKEMGDGFRVMESSCIACHNPDPAINNKVSPSFTEIKKAYIQNSSDIESFTALFIQFLANPSSDNAIVHGAIDKYGVMPKFDISETEAKNLATYLYLSPLEKPDWYTKYYSLDKENFKAYDDEISPMELGKKYALSTKAILGKNLKGAIKNKGTMEAVNFCNSKAYPLTDSMSVALNAHIKRVSDQPRNPKNQASELELAYIVSSKGILAKGEGLKPQMQELNGKMVGYYPITTNAMCMQCHGEVNTQIKPEVFKNIQELYPSDLATGYGENELRGIWVVTMDKTN